MAAVQGQTKALLPGLQDAQAPDNLEREESLSVRHGFLFLVFFSKTQNPHPPQGCIVFQAKFFKVKFEVVKVNFFKEARFKFKSDKELSKRVNEPKWLSSCFKKRSS